MCCVLLPVWVGLTGAWLAMAFAWKREAER